MKPKNWMRTVRFVVEMIFILTMGMTLGFMVFLLIMKLLWMI